MAPSDLFENRIEPTDHKLLLFAGEFPDLLQAQRQLRGWSRPGQRMDFDRLLEASQLSTI
jgi:hypothetical protein